MARVVARPGGRRTPLTRERVLTAAVEFADAQGLGALTMRKLGEVLGVEAMSLYNHVTNKDRLLDGMVDVVFAEIRFPTEGVDWRTAMRARAVSVRAVLARHPWAITMMEARSSPGPATLHQHDAVLGCLRAAGFSLPMAGHAFALLDSFIYGFALTEASLPLDGAEQTADLAHSIFSGFGPGEYPHLTEFTTGHVLRPGYSYAAEFEYCLDLVLDTLDRTLHPSP